MSCCCGKSLSSCSKAEGLDFQIFIIIPRTPEHFTSFSGMLTAAHKGGCTNERKRERGKNSLFDSIQKQFVTSVVVAVEKMLQKKSLCENLRKINPFFGVFICALIYLTLKTSLIPTHMSSIRGLFTN